jgi:proprotein convertase subtilisin/kexin type 2
VALMLSVNPNLTWRDVKLILARSAKPIDSLDTGWVQTQNPALGLSYRFHPNYGFGAVDAAAAVRLATNWVSVGTSAQLQRCELRLEPSQGGTGIASDISDNGVALQLSASLLSADCSIKHIEHVELQLDADHEYSGDLSISLAAPSGSESQMAQARLCGSSLRDKNDCGDYRNWRFASVRHLDESPLGQWRLQVTDKAPGKQGRLNRANIVVYGR